MSSLFSGSVVGNSICAHPDVRKVGFTGSTETGKSIMERYKFHPFFGYRTLFQAFLADD